MSALTRRPITPAVSARLGARWEDDATCRTVGRDPFYVDSLEGQKAARTVCASCPVLVECLTAAQRQEAWSQDRWGMAGGLTAPQRLGLVWEERLHGVRPDLAKARELTGWRWARTIRRLHTKGLALEEIAREIGGTTAQHVVTTRLALWWLGLEGTRVRRRAPGDQTSKWQRVAAAHQEEIERMRAMGAGRFDVSAYLGVSVNCGVLATTQVNKAAVAELEVAA
ncbi:WhiB family transcriptional regulator [Streptomyces sp. NPDC056069]|uniref:WhiB family transcriptional regulator n=1 Tax=Streptomyces sp. NPDC056069 TaxID=3345702 RepID=UPI0035DA8189